MIGHFVLGVWIAKHISNPDVGLQCHFEWYNLCFHWLLVDREDVGFDVLEREILTDLFCVEAYK